ncbi:AAA ATPase [Toensbergia leucococca]|nr:AAA ATPase [Toensbergia leucococca]
MSRRPQLLRVQDSIEQQASTPVKAARPPRQWRLQSWVKEQDLSMQTKATTQHSDISSRVKRRAPIPILNDENADPSLGHHNQHVTRHDLCMDLDELENPFITPRKPSRGASVPAKHTVNEGRVALSPTKINSQFKTTKPISGESTKTVQAVTPQTPRHRDALCKKIPITPRHRINVVTKPWTPRTPRTPLTPSSVPTLYNTARQLFVRSANPGRLIGRDEERHELNTFIQEGVQSKSGRCIYVSGPPGTGKSALVSEVSGNVLGTQNVRKTYVNCMSVKGSKDIYGKLIEDLIGDAEDLGNDEMSILRATFLPKKGASEQVYIVTLDEIDHLLTLDLEILYTLFEWSLHRSSRLILIGIANALDLTDRFLPRLKARNLRPQLLPFLPYTAPQIASVITSKLRSLNLPSDSLTSSDFTPFVNPTAIQFCSKKIASQTGDLRRAFDIIRRTIDLVETEVKQTHISHTTTHPLQVSPTKGPLYENPNLSSPTKQLSVPTNPLSHLNPLTAPRATIAHIARISATALGNGTSQRLQTLNLQQKAALCALLSHEKNHRASASQTQKTLFAPATTPSKKNTNSAPTIRKLYETYCSLCKREGALHALTATEFVDVVGGLETIGLVGEGGGRRGGIMMTSGKKAGRGEERRVVCFVGEEELEGCLEGAGGAILRALLRGE